MLPPIAKSAGDGYTLSMVAMGHAINPLLYKKVPCDNDRDMLQELKLVLRAHNSPRISIA